MHISKSDNERVALDLLNPLESVVNLLYLIRHDQADSDKVVQWLDLADGEIRRIVDVLRRELSQP